jgi:hypothetical protein
MSLSMKRIIMPWSEDETLTRCLDAAPTLYWRPRWCLGNPAKYFPGFPGQCLHSSHRKGNRARPDDN